MDGLLLIEKKIVLLLICCLMNFSFEEALYGVFWTATFQILAKSLVRTVHKQYILIEIVN